MITKISVVYNTIPLIVVQHDAVITATGQDRQEIDFNELGAYVQILSDQQAALGKFVSFTKGTYEQNNTAYDAIVLAASEAAPTNPFFDRDVIVDNRTNFNVGMFALQGYIIDAVQNLNFGFSQPCVFRTFLFNTPDLFVFKTSDIYPLVGNEPVVCSLQDEDGNIYWSSNSVTGTKLQPDLAWLIPNWTRFVIGNAAGGSLIPVDVKLSDSIMAICSVSAVTKYTDLAPVVTGSTLYDDAAGTTPIVETLVVLQDNQVYVVTAGVVGGLAAPTTSCGFAIFTLIGGLTEGLINICADSRQLFSSAASIVPGALLFTNASGDTPLLGFTQVMETSAGIIYNLDPATGQVGSATGNAC